MSRQDALPEPSSAREPHVACIHLTGGSSDDSVWVLEEGVGGTFLTIGSDPECEWQVRAPGVPSHAIAVLLIAGIVYVRSGPQRGVRMNGNLLSQDWLRVEEDSRLVVGLASLEIKLGKDSLLPSLRDLPTPQVPESAPAPKRGKQRAPVEAERSGMRRSYVQEADMRRTSPDAQKPRAGSARSQRGGSSVWLYVLSAAALAGAYAFWLTLLD